MNSSEVSPRKPIFRAVKRVCFQPGFFSLSRDLIRRRSASSPKRIRFIGEQLERLSASTVSRWFATYRRDGLDAVLSRGYGIGRPSGLDEEVEAYLRNGLKNTRWNTAEQAREELQRHFGRPFNYRTVWLWLKKCAGVLRVPRPVHEKRDSSKAEAFKRNFLGILKDVPIIAKKPVKLWFADESRYGLLPNLRRLWTLKGLRPHKRWQSKYQWSYCYGALDPIDGETVFLQAPSVNMEWTEVFLKEIKAQYPDYEHIVVWDGAGFHPKHSSHERVHDMRDILNAILYLNKTGCQWRMLPNHFPPWETVYDHYRRMKERGVWKQINERLNKESRKNRA